MSCGQFESERRQMRSLAATFTIAPVRGAADVDAVRALFRQYGATPGVDVCVQGFDAEIAALPGAYAEPRGTLLLARVAGVPAGCVALKPVTDTVAEMKRLFVLPPFRGKQIGEALTAAAIDAARARAFARLRLDTLPSMLAARAIYSRLGFTPVQPFGALSIADAGDFERAL